MTAPRNHESISPDLAGYSMDALDDETRELVEQHLAGCEDCTSELEELMEGAANLAFAVPTVSPPPGLQDRINAAIDADMNLSGEQPVSIGNSHPAVSTPDVSLASPVRLPWYANTRLAWGISSSIAAAFIALIAVAGVAGIRLNDRVDDFTAQVAAQDSEIVSFTASLRSLEDEANLASNAEAQQVSVLQKSTDMLEQQLNDLRWLQYVTSVGSWSTPSFFSGGLQPEAPQGVLITHSSGDQAFLMVNGLAPAPAGSVYQVWLTYEGSMVPGNTFSVDQDGYAVVNLDLTGDATEYIGASVTVEPFGGSVIPSDFTVLIGSDQ
jgi:cell division protein FtsB